MYNQFRLKSLNINILETPILFIMKRIGVSIIEK